MPVINNSSFKPPWWLKNRHLQTIVSSVLPYRSLLNPSRERISTPDKDFLDLDWHHSQDQKNKLIILSHGLEGNSQANYVISTVSSLVERGYDCLAWNFRGCSGEPNQNFYSYHSGYTQDLSAVIEHVKKNYQYTEINLVGFSVGGNITLKYLGEENRKEINKAVVFSVPTDLAESAAILAQKKNFIYMNYFLRKLKKKIVLKRKFFPDELLEYQDRKIKNFYDFDLRYTAPHFGYKSPEEYWEENSSNTYLDKIKVQTLIVNSLDDPFLGRNCYPEEICLKSNNLSLELVKEGGHVGFLEGVNRFWMGKRVLEFIRR